MSFLRSFKNQTPRGLSIMAASTSALLVGFLLLSLKWIGWMSMSYKALLIIFIGILLIDYISNYFYIRHYIYRKIKLIYKVIHRHKHGDELKEDKLNMDADVLQTIEQEVKAWALESAEDMEKLEALATYRRRFLGDVSHELKTPIFNIQGFLHTLLDGAIDDPEVNMNYLLRASKNVERLQAIVEDLETINKLESGQMVLDENEFNLKNLVEEVFLDLEMRAKERSVTVKFKDGAASSYQVRADKESIRQVLLNLVHNSIKYGKEGGTTKVSFYDMASTVLVEVSDNGIGISEKHLDHVFDRFYRIDKSRSRDAGGTGLGLSIVKHIIEAHNQTITVRSTVGSGSTFGFTLAKED